MPEKMESYVYCPNCGELVHIILEPFSNKLNDFLSTITEAVGLSDDLAQHFGNAAGTKCKCGKTINATIHVTAM